MEFSYRDFSESKANVFFGYWQKGDHLNIAVYERLKEKLKDIIENVKCVDNVVHVRRGDFLQENMLSREYYSKVADCASLPVAHYYFISKNKEDEVVLDGFKYKHSYVSSDGVIKDFSLIWSANTVICSNSTFCYWAAALGESKNVVVPSHLTLDREFLFPFFGKSVSVVPAAFEMAHKR